MKKLMFAAIAAVAMAATASAGQCLWGYWGEAVDHEGEAFTGGSGLLLVLKSAGAIPTFDEKTGWNMNGAVIADAAAYNATDMGWGYTDWRNLADINPGTVRYAEQQYLAIFLTEKKGVETLEDYEGYYAVALVGQGEQMVYEPSGPTYGTDFETYDTTVSKGSWINATQSSVPEPTSGLLLLLGVAGLALRRRRA